MFTAKQIERLAKQIKAQFGERLSEFPNDLAAFLAGLIAVECRKTSTGFDESCKRFEPHVFEKLKALHEGRISKYNNIVKKDIEDASIAALRNLATSFGATQIMGWHTVKNLNASIADLRDPSKHLHYTAQLLHQPPASRYLGKYWESVYRIWNTGRPDGKTYDPNYVQNAMAVMKAYRALDKTAHQTTESNHTLQASIEEENESSEDKKIIEPEKYNGIGFWATIKRDLSVAGLGNVTVGSVVDILNQTANLPAWMSSILSLILYVVFAVTCAWFLFRIVHYVVDSWKQQNRVQQQIDNRK